MFLDSEANSARSDLDLTGRRDIKEDEVVIYTNRGDNLAKWLPVESWGKCFFFILTELSIEQPGPDWTSLIGNQRQLRKQLLFLFLAPSHRRIRAALVLKTCVFFSMIKKKSDIVAFSFAL